MNLGHSVMIACVAGRGLVGERAYKMAGSRCHLAGESFYASRLTDELRVRKCIDE